MSLKVTFFAILTIFLTTSALASQPNSAAQNSNSVSKKDGRIYESAQGPIKIATLENSLSTATGLKVEITSIRWSYNPSRYAAYVILKAFGMSYATYVVKMSINHFPSTCNMFVAVNDKHVFFAYCSGVGGQLFSEKLSLDAQQVGFIF